MSVHVEDRHLRLAEKLVAKAQRNGGLAPLDIPRFWADQDKASQDPWAQDCPQVPLGIFMSNDCCFAEMGEPEDMRRLEHDSNYRLELVKRYNDKAETVTGRRLLGEWKPNPAHVWTGIQALSDIFEAKSVWMDTSYWLQESAHTEAELTALLDRVERRLDNLRAFVLPPDWAEQKARVTAAGGKVPLYRGQRGPVTFAMSVFGVENVIYLILDNPALAGRFRDLIINSTVTSSQASLTAVRSRRRA